MLIMVGGIYFLQLNIGISFGTCGNSSSCSGNGAKELKLQGLIGINTLKGMNVYFGRG